MFPGTAAVSKPLLLTLLQAAFLYISFFIILIAKNKKELFALAFFTKQINNQVAAFLRPCTSPQKKKKTYVR
jgi:hypothetical protein